MHTAHGGEEGCGASGRDSTVSVSVETRRSDDLYTGASPDSDGVLSNPRLVTWHDLICRHGDFRDHSVSSKYTHDTKSVDFMSMKANEHP